MHSLRGTLTLAGILWAGLTLYAAPSQASELAAILEKQAVRAALETTEGRTLFRALGLAAGDTPSLIRLTERAAAAPLREELARALSRIEAEASGLRSHRESLGAPMSATEERFFVNLLSRRLLEIGDLSEFTRRFGPQSIAFVDEAAVQGTLAGRSRIFLEGTSERTFGQNLSSERAAEAAASDHPATRSSELLAESSPGAASSLRRSITGFMDEMRACQLAQPPGAAQSSRTRYLLTSLGVGEALTVGGYIVGMGTQNFNIEELSTDMLVAAAYTLAGSSVLRPNQRFAVQWIKVAGAIVAQDALDATIYFISPMHRIRTGTSLHTPEQAFSRFAFSSAYTTSFSSWREVLMYEVISGLQCLYPTSRWTPIGTTGLRLLDGAMGTLLYYRARRQIIGH